MTRTAQLTYGEMKQLHATLIQGVPDDLAPERVRDHIGSGKGRLHEAMGLILRANLSQVDLTVLRAFLQEHEVVKRFQPGVLDEVQALGGQFARAQMTTILAGETLDSQRGNKVIKFWTDWRFQSDEKERLSIAPSVGSEVVYLPRLLEDSLGCTFDKVEKKRSSVQEILDTLPKVDGVRWIVGNAPTINRVLANHHAATGEYLLSGGYTWTTDIYQSPHSGQCRLFVGRFYLSGVGVFIHQSSFWDRFIGLFVLGVPA